MHPSRLLVASIASIGMAVVFFLSLLASATIQGSELKLSGSDRLDLKADWKMQSGCATTLGGGRISSAGFQPVHWIQLQSPPRPGCAGCIRTDQGSLLRSTASLSWLARAAVVYGSAGTNGLRAVPDRRQTRGASSFDCCETIPACSSG